MVRTETKSDNSGDVDLDQAIFHTFTCRCWQAPCAVGLTEERLRARQLQASITYITGMV